MLRCIALTILFLTTFQWASSASAGIIGVGGSNADENPELLLRLKNAEAVSVDEAFYRRISGRISAQGAVTVEIENKRKEMERAEFMKVYLNNEPHIVDSNVRMELRRSAP